MVAKTFSGGEKLKAALEKISKNIHKASTLNTGFLSGATYPDGTLVAMVAAIQEFGAPAAGIPPRPFFRIMIANNSGHWAEDLGTLLRLNDYDASKALQLMGHEIKAELQESIQQLESPKLADTTIARKGFSKPLIDTSHMINSVDFEVLE